MGEIKLSREGEHPNTNAIRLVAILVMSNEAERATDPFERRLRLNEMQEAIQAAKPDIEALAEGLMFIEDDNEPE